MNPPNGAQKTCYVVGTIADPKKANDPRWILQQLIAPVLGDYPEYDLQHASVNSRPAAESRSSLDAVLHADLVIANISNTSPTTAYEVSVRHQARKPIIYLASLETSRQAQTKGLGIIYYDTQADVTIARRQLSQAIRDIAAFDSSNRPDGNDEHTRPQSRMEFAARIDGVADAIFALRNNELGEEVEKLRKISAELRADTSALQPSIKQAATKALQLIAQLFDTLGTSQGAQILIAGAVGSLLSAAGWPAVVVYTITLSVWQGKEAFLKALDALGRGRHSTEMAPDSHTSKSKQKHSAPKAERPRIELPEEDADNAG